MKRIIKRFIIIVLCICIALAMLSACGSSSNGSTRNSDSSSSSKSYSYSYDPTAYYKIKSADAAIKAVKNDYMFESYIRWELGFNKNYSPNIGSTTAEKSTEFRYKKNKNTGSYEGGYWDCWEVTIKGNMSGYTDAYLKNFENYGFKLTATVMSEDGEVRNIKVENMG
ncbi:MAG: hypothetical protein IJU94_05415 [Clostridia bacterium]|nr:hypothetical protein [Clostridia bacterium]